MRTCSTGQEFPDASRPDPTVTHEFDRRAPCRRLAAHPLIAVIVLALGAGLPAASTAALELSVNDQGPGTYEAGDSVVLTIDFDFSAEPVYAGGIDIYWDAEAFSDASWTSSGIGDPAFNTDPVIGPGAATGATFGDAGGLSGGVIGTLTLTAASDATTGAYTVTVGQNQDPFPGPLISWVTLLPYPPGSVESIPAEVAILGVAPNRFSPEFALADLTSAGGGDGSNGYLLNGIDSVDLSGITVGTAGDVNGDGLDDVIIGAIMADPGGLGGAGEAYVVFGTDTPASAEFELSDLLPANGGDGTRGFVLNGVAGNDQTGMSLGTAGDVNADGFDDVIVGAFWADPGGRNGAGRTYVVFGKPSGFPAQINLSSLLAAHGGDGSVGFAINGIAVDDKSGNDVATAGDVNHDGIDDIVIGAVARDPLGRLTAGEAYVVYGTDLGFAAEFELSSLLAVNGGDDSRGFVLHGAVAQDRVGEGVAAAGDVNGDDIDDLIIGAYGARSWTGQSYIVFGSATGFPAEIDLATLHAAGGGDGSEGVVLLGINASDYTGQSGAGAGDINGDGFDDVIVGASEADPGGRSRAGRSYVVFGTDQGFPAEIDLSGLLAANGGDGTVGTVLNGVDGSDFSGISVGAAGDFDGDGIGDLIVGAYQLASGGPTGPGEVCVVFGTTLGFPPEIELSTLLPANGGDGSAGMMIYGIDVGDYTGGSVGAAGDTNGDGGDDLIIGGAGADPGGRSAAGETYVVFGKKRDSDGDSIPDRVDNCTYALNPRQVDTDGDHFGNACDPDIAPAGNDCVVNAVDLGAMKLAFFATPGAANWNPDADVSGPYGVPDGVINVLDLGLMKIHFFGEPGAGLYECFPAGSGFSGPYEMQNWSSSGIYQGTTDITPSSGPSVQGDFYYDVNLGQPGPGIPFRTATFSAIAAASGTVSLDYRYTGFHAFWIPEKFLQMFADGPSGRQTVTLESGSTWGYFTYIGSGSIAINEGYPFGIIVGGSNYDSNSRLVGTVEITNLTTPF